MKFVLESDVKVYIETFSLTKPGSLGPMLKKELQKVRFRYSKFVTLGQHLCTYLSQRLAYEENRQFLLITSSIAVYLILQLKFSRKPN